MSEIPKKSEGAEGTTSPHTPEVAKYRGGFKAALLGALGLAVGGTVGGVAGFGYGVEKAVEVAPAVTANAILREYGERSEEAKAFVKTVEPLFREMILGLADFMSALESKAENWDSVMSGAMVIYEGLKKDAVEWLANDDTSFDRTMEEIGNALSANPDLGPKWKKLEDIYAQLKVKQGEFSDLTDRITGVTAEDGRQIQEELKKAMKEEIAKDLPW